MKKINICSVASDLYLEGLYYFILSFNKDYFIDYEIEFNVEFVNISENKIKYFKNKFKNLNIINTNMEFQNNKQLRGYCTNRRFYILNKTLKKYDYSIYADSNSLFSNNFDNLIEILDNNLGLLCVNKNHKVFKKNLKYRFKKGPLGSIYYGVVKAGFIALKKSLICENFINTCIEYNKKRSFSWYADQESIYLTISNNKKFNHFKHLETQFILHKNNSVPIICMKGNKKSNDYLNLEAEVLKLYKYDLETKNTQFQNNHLNHRYNPNIILKIVRRIIFGNETILFNYFLNKIYILISRILRINLYNFFKFQIFKFFKYKFALFNFKYGKIILDLKDNGISKILSTYGIREEDKIDLIKNILKKDDIIIDCGSNIGFYPLIESKFIGKNGLIVCIEPDKRNINIFKKNSRFISSNFLFYDISMSNEDGLSFWKEASETNLSLIPKNENDSSYSVKTKKITTLLNELNEKGLDLNKIRLLRMDIEGGEQNVLEDLLQTTYDLKNINIVFEVHPNLYDREKMKNILENYIINKYQIKILVSSKDPKPNMFEYYGLDYSKSIYSDNALRNFYENVPSEQAINLILNPNKQTRYAVISK